MCSGAASTGRHTVGNFRREVSVKISIEDTKRYNTAEDFKT